MSKLYAIKLNNGNLHKNNMGEIVYFSKKNDVRAYMKYNHYDGIIQPLNIDLKKDQKISDLETKLAESEKEHELLIDQFEEATEELRKQIKQESDARKRFVEEVKNLKQQLAEKEEELENYKLCKCVNCKNEYEFMLEGLVEDLEKQIDKDEQDKISFAVEQLNLLYKTLTTEEVWKVIKRSWLWNGECKQLRELIDNQIKQLKERK